MLADPGCACRESARARRAGGRHRCQAQPWHKRITGSQSSSASAPLHGGGGLHTRSSRPCAATLGRVIYSGGAIPNTNVPGLIGGFAGERVLRAPADGAFRSVHRIGDLVKAGDVAGYVSGEPMVCTIDGVLRGLIADGIPVRKGMKSGDVDPRGNVENCYTVSDKATAVGGGVLEAILHLSGALLED